MNNPFAEIDDRLNKIEQLLTQLLAQQPAQNNVPDEVGGIDLAEQVTGLKKATIYCHVHGKKIPHFKRGNKLYFSKKALQDWITEDVRGSPKVAVTTPIPKLLFPFHRKKNK